MRKKPCPCGRKYQRKIVCVDGWKVKWKYVCPKCKRETPWVKSESQLISAWNTIIEKDDSVNYRSTVGQVNDGYAVNKADSTQSNAVPTCFQRISNADRIRSMSDEELAETLFNGAYCPMLVSKETSGVSTYNCHSRDGCLKNGVSCWTEWLKQEVSDAEK